MQYGLNLDDKLIPMYRLLQKTVKFVMTDSVRDFFFKTNENLAKTANMTLRLLLPEKQLIVKCHAGEHAAG